MKYDNQLRYAVNIVNDYDGRFPLAAWLKDFFRANKQMGSRDRRTVSEMVYGYFRLGRHRSQNIEDRILTALYAGGHLPEVAEYFNTSRGGDASVSIPDIFPWSSLLSEGVDPDAFAVSFLVQPDLFIRIRPGKENEVITKLNGSNVPYTRTADDCVALPNSTKIDALLQLNKEVVIQDRSSQQTGKLMSDISFKTVWDCCAGSGGKAIMSHDNGKDIELTVSDIRESILANLKIRFNEAGISAYRAFLEDLSAPQVKLPDQKYDLVIADLPCTGSGTWSRTPEQLCFFTEEKIQHYTRLQEKILTNIIPKVAPGGHLLYITCSVFRQENEEMANKILRNADMRLVRQELIRAMNIRPTPCLPHCLQTRQLKNGLVFSIIVLEEIDPG